MKGLKLASRAAVVAAAVMAYGLGTAHAVPLSDLIFGNGSITVGDKTFASWEFEFDDGSVACDQFCLDSIDVTGIADDPFNPGLKFTASNDVLTVSGGDFIDFGIGFSVMVGNPNLQISGASLALSDFVNGGDGLIQIDDFVFDTAFGGLGSLFVEADAIFGDTLFDAIGIAPQTTVFQEIEIFIDSGFDGDVVGINMFEIRKQQVGEVPEPASLSLFVAGLLALGALGRRRAAG